MVEDDVVLVIKSCVESGNDGPFQVGHQLKFEFCKPRFVVTFSTFDKADAVRNQTNLFRMLTPTIRFRKQIHKGLS